MRAQLRHKWDSESVNAQIHALTGNNKDKLLAYGSIIMFVASACATHAKLGTQDVKFRIIQGSINALDDLKDREAITTVDRGSIYAGLIASQEMIQNSPIEVVNDAANMYYKFSENMGAM
jgi:hypothetical protein